MQQPAVASVLIKTLADSHVSRDLDVTLLMQLLRVITSAMYLQAVSVASISLIIAHSLDMQQPQPSVQQSGNLAVTDITVSADYAGDKVSSTLVVEG
jgi:hypothetical protein